MALAYLKDRLSLEEYIENRDTQDKSTGRATKGAARNAQLFCQDEFGGREFVTVLSDIRETVLETHQLDTALIFLQKFVNWLSKPHLHLRMTPNAVYKEGAPCIAKDVGTIRGYVAQTRLIMKKVGGIPISSDDVKDYKLSYPPPADREPLEKMTLEEYRLICDNQHNFRRHMMYRIMKDTESRIAPMVQLRKKHFDTTKRPIEVFFPKSIMKKKNGISYDNTKYVIEEDEEGILKLLSTIKDDDLVFGVTENVTLAVNDEEKVWSRLVQNLGFTARYKHNNFLKKNIHSTKSMTFTFARKAVDLDFANAYGDHSAYIKNYLRLSDEEKIVYFKRLEPYISMYTKTKIIHDNEELYQENSELKKKLSNHDAMLEKISEELHDMKIKQKDTPEDNPEKGGFVT